jgi:hypothetical protein
MTEKKLEKEEKCKYCVDGKRFEYFKEPMHVCLDENREMTSGLCNAVMNGQDVKCEWCCGTGIHTPLSEDPYI